MPLPDSGSVTVQGGSSEPKVGVLVKVPNHILQQFETAAKDNSQRFKISLEGGFNIVQPNGEVLSLGVHATGTPTEVHSLDALQAALQPVALASTRVSVPISAPPNKTKNQAGNPVKPGLATAKSTLPAKPVASLLAKNVTATSMARTQSSPVGVGATPNSPAPAPVSASPKVPLKTRVIQLLALGDYSEAEIAEKVQAPAADAMRVVNVLGRSISSNPVKYGLQPGQYSKVKIGDWPYLPKDRRAVVERARSAFAELGLPPSADEYAELDRKVQEASKTSASDTSNSSSTSGVKRVLPKIKKYTPEEMKEKAALEKAARKAKPKTPKTAIGKVLEKHRAERRASSPLPPRKETGMPARPTMSGKSDKKPVKSTMTREKAYYTSSSSSEDEDEAPASAARESSSPPIKTPALPPTTTSVKRSAGVDENSPPKRIKKISPTLPNRPLEDCPEMEPDQDPLRAEPLQRQRTVTMSRSQSNETEALRGNYSNASTPPSQKSPQQLRDRYEELYPAYVQLAEKIKSSWRHVDDMNNMHSKLIGEDEAENMVEKYHRWHAELEGIRAAFRDGSPLSARPG